LGKRNHSAGKLSAISLKTLGDGMHADGGNLYLYVRGESREWVFRYTSPINNDRRKMGLGSLTSVGLADARRLAETLRTQVKNPIDPIDPINARNAASDLRKATAMKRTTFKQAAEQFMKVKRSEWTNPKHAAQWVSTFETYVYPRIGGLGIDLIEPQHIVKLLQQDIKSKQGVIEGSFWEVRGPTAERVMGRIKYVFDYAKASKLCAGDNPSVWKGLLENLLPKQMDTEEHLASLPYKQIGDFMPKLGKKKGTSARALEFLIMTVVRSGSIRMATWSQIDFEELVWNIPDENTKTKVAHKVPLTPQMVAFLEALPTFKGCDYIFPNANNNPLSDMALSEIMRGMLEKGEILEDAVPHGFRSTFSVWAAEQTYFPDEIRKACRMHAVSDSTKKAYERTDFFDKRRELMTQWSKFLSQPSIKKLAKSKSNVINIKEVA